MKKAVVVVAAVACCFVAVLLLRNTRPVAFSPATNPNPTSTSPAAVKPDAASIPPASATVGTIATQSVRVAVPSDGRHIAAFAEWLRRYQETPQAGRDAMVDEGRALAEARRPELKQWIQSDPRRALSAAVSMVARQELPPAIVELLEERVNGRGALRVYQGVGPDNRSP